MKKELFALALLAALFAGSLFNTRFIGSLTDDMTAALDKSADCCAAGDYSGALESAGEAVELWSSRAAWAGIFIRHTEIDAVSYGFLELTSALESDEPEGAGALYSGLEAHIESLYAMERLTIASIF